MPVPTGVPALEKMVARPPPEHQLLRPVWQHGDTGRANRRRLERRELADRELCGDLVPEVVGSTVVAELPDGDAAQAAAVDEVVLEAQRLCIVVVQLTPRVVIARARVVHRRAVP